MIEINFHHLRVFHAVARQLSYSRAAEQLYISQPAISRQIQDLEKAVGALVFHRQGRRISLTDAGRRVYDYAQRVLDLTDDLEQAIRELEDVTRGHVRIVASSTLGNYVLPSFFGVFRRRYPEVDVSLQVSNSQQVIAAMRQGEHHLGFVSIDMEAPGLQWLTLAADELVVVSHSAHVLAGQTVTAQELCLETLLLREPGSGTRRCLELELERLGQKPQRIMELGSTEAIKRAVAAGLGLSAIPRRSLTQEELNGALGLVIIEGMELRRSLGMVTRKGARMPPAALAFSAAVQKAGI